MLVNFKTDFGFEAPNWSPIRHEGWTINGQYQTKTATDGSHYLHFEGELQSPYQLSLTSEHGVGWVISPDTELASTEVYYARWK